MQQKHATYISIGIIVLVFAFVYFLNIAHIDYAHIESLSEMNDVPGILAGYHASPNLLVDSLKWWHGPWIQQGVDAYRPLSSYLLWIESAIVLKYGFAPIIAIGGFLLLVICWLSSLVSWQLTKSYWYSGFAGILGAFVTNFNYGGTNTNWLSWYPVHHDLANIMMALAATWAFLKWAEHGHRKHIALCWGFFIAGLLFKEYLYIFPIMVLVITFTSKSTFAHRKRLLLHPALMLFAVAGFYLFRQSVLPDPYMPHSFTSHMLITHSLLFWFHSFYLYLPAGLYVLPMLSLLMYAAIALKREYPEKYFWCILLVASVVLMHTTKGILDFFWYFADGKNGLSHINYLAQMIFTFYTFHLAYKYRKSHNGILAYALMMMAYLPTFTYLGWHYSLSGWFFRAAIFWPVMAQLVWDDVSPMFEKHSPEIESSSVRT